MDIMAKLYLNLHTMVGLFAHTCVDGMSCFFLASPPILTFDPVFEVGVVVIVIIGVL